MAGSWSPTVAARLKAKFMRNPQGYASVFSEDVSLEVWPAIVEVIKRAEAALETVRPSGAQGERQTYFREDRSAWALLSGARRPRRRSRKEPYPLPANAFRCCVVRMLGRWLSSRSSPLYVNV